MTNPFVVHGVCRHCSRRTFIGRAMRHCPKCVAQMRSVVVALLYPGGGRRG